MEDRDAFLEEGYELTEPLASDCWGELYRAVYLPHRREVLFRRFSHGLAAMEGAWPLMQAEIQAWARLDHPNVLQVLDWGLADSGAFLATRMPEGLLLSGCLEERGDNDPLEICAPLLEAVEAARRRGILHLSLRAGNVWVQREGEPSVLVSEYGFWYVARQYPEACQFDGTFLSPEQRDLGRGGAASDVYALGLLLASLYDGMEDALRLAEGGPWSGPSRLAPVLSRCLEEQPLARYATAGELAGALGFAEPTLEEGPREDCPFCRIAAEAASDSGSMRPPPRDLTRGAEVDETRTAGPLERYAWAIIAALALATLVVWWLAFR